MGLPVYELVIEEGDHTGVTGVALVDRPAIQLNWQAFNEQRPIKFQTFSEEERIVSGPLMVADLKIFRSDERGEYLVYFAPETIKKIVYKFFKNKYTGNVNPMHDSMLLLPGVFMCESFFINSSRGINTPNGWDALQDGSWFGSLKVDNDEVWNEYVKTGKFTGFSVEGFFNEVPNLTESELSMVSQIIFS